MFGLLNRLLTRPPAPSSTPTARERQSAVERSIREEARRLRQGQGGGEAGGAGAAAAGRKNVDLESLAFVQGAHFNSSKQCTLPQVKEGCRLCMAAGEFRALGCSWLVHMHLWLCAHDVLPLTVCS